MLLKMTAFVFGIAFIVIGVLGFVPAVTQDGFLFNVFMVDPIHDMIHLGSGVIALIAAINIYYARLYFQILGFVYGLIAVLGFALDGNLYFMQVNMADNLLHAVIAMMAFYFGFLHPLNE